MKRIRRIIEDLDYLDKDLNNLDEDVFNDISCISFKKMRIKEKTEMSSVNTICPLQVVSNLPLTTTNQLDEKQCQKRVCNMVFESLNNRVIAN